VFAANYTWSKGLDDVTEFNQEGAQGAYTADPTRIRQIDYDVAENDLQNRFALLLNYQFAAGYTFTNGIEKFARVAQGTNRGGYTHGLSDGIL
jgi:hypothetical protein